MVAWYWIFVAVLVGAFLGVFCLCLFQITAKDQKMDGPIDGNGRGNRRRRMEDLDAERRMIALSITRVK